MSRSLLLTLAALAAAAAAHAQDTAAPSGAALPATAPAAMPPAAATFGRPKRGGSLGNNYAGQLIVINERTLRITTRKRVSGSLEEINKPGSSVYKALQAVADAASLRNLTSAQQPRANSMNASGEAGYTFAPGKYDESIEVAIELTIELLPSGPPDPAIKEVYEVDPILKRAGIGG
jgi:hypothetical protein